MYVYVSSVDSMLTPPSPVLHRRSWMPCRTRQRRAAPSSVSLELVSTRHSWWRTVSTFSLALQIRMHPDTSGPPMGESNESYFTDPSPFNLICRKTKTPQMWEQMGHSHVLERILCRFLVIGHKWDNQSEWLYFVFQLWTFWNRGSQWGPTGNKNRTAPERWLQGVFLWG